jgi:MFS family permease
MSSKRQLLLFFAAVLVLSAGGSVNDSLFNNFLVDTFKISADTRGWLELPREAPGFLVVVMAGILAALPVTQVGMVGGAILSVGMIGLALLGGNWALMILMMALGSAGMHLIQPVSASLAIGLGDPATRGKRMGEMSAIGNLGTILGAGFVWLFFSRTAPQYRTGFLCAAALAAVGAIVYSRMSVPHLHQARSRFVMKKKFRLYYLLELFFGARKQVFITFGPWILIKVYGQQATAIAGLLMTSAFIGIGFKPLVGRAIDRFGERAVLITDALALVFVCVGYGYAISLMGGDMKKARLLACGCFILDDLLFSLGAARSVYASRLASDPQELTSTLSLGISINHVISMTIPAVAGAIWVIFGYQKVFAAAAVLAVFIAVLASQVPRKQAAR